MNQKRISVLLALPFCFAAVWATVASLYVLFAPYGTSMSTVMSADGQSIAESVTRSSFLESQGMWGTSVLVLFAGLYICVAACALLRRTTPLVITGLLVCALTILAGFSVGYFYFPAMLSVLAGLWLVGMVKIWGRLWKDSEPGSRASLG